MEKCYVCCFTGHRSIPFEQVDKLLDILDGTVNKLIKNGVTTFRTGGAIGFDTIAALKIIEKKRVFPELRLELYLPCPEQSKKWTDYNKKAYDYVISQADKIIYTSQSYFKGCMLHRDRVMVDGSDFCVAYCTKASGGTAYTLDYAKKQGVKAFNLDILMRNRG